MEIRTAATGLLLIGAVGAGVSVFAGLGRADAGKTTVVQKTSSAASNKAVYAIDSSHSSMMYSIRHNGVSNFMGQFFGMSGTFECDPESGQLGEIKVSVKADTLNTGNEKRDGHLKSGDFFSVREFSEITFVGSATTLEAGKGTVTGELTLLGVTKSIQADAEFIGSAQGRGGSSLAGFEVTFDIKRSDFGMNYGIAQGSLGDVVSLTASFEGAAQ